MTSFFYSDMQEIIRKQRAFFDSGATLPVGFRIQSLQKLKAGILAHEKSLLAALYRDLRKSEIEAYTTEVGFVLAEIDHAIKHINSWCRPQRVKISRLNFPARGCIVPEPKGVVLIFAPWNYPLQLLFVPLVSALAAGNCAVLKPSELAPAVSAAIAALIHDTFARQHVAVIEGGPDAAWALLQEAFDHIFFTGSTATGRLVMEAAAKNLIPVTLELGGKSPCIVLQDADIDVAARRIMWGKFLNAGQTCVAPDYVLVESTVKDAFIAAAVRTIGQFFGPEPRTSPWYGRIISRQHFNRLAGYLQGSTIICGGACDEDDLYMAPTLLDPGDMSMPVMQEEIFGPLLPVLACSGLEEALGMVRSRPTPLAFYLFTRSRAAQDRVVQNVQCGGVCINDTISHILERGLPFGGLGASGMGAYHGRAGFDCFTHYKSVLRKGFFPDLRLKYPPYTLSLKRMKALFRFLCS